MTKWGKEKKIKVVEPKFVGFKRSRNGTRHGILAPNARVINNGRPSYAPPRLYERRTLSPEETSEFLGAQELPRLPTRSTNNRNPPAQRPTYVRSTEPIYVQREPKVENMQRTAGGRALLKARGYTYHPTKQVICSYKPPGQKLQPRLVPPGWGVSARPSVAATTTNRAGQIMKPNGAGGTSFEKAEFNVFKRNRGI